MMKKKRLSRFLQMKRKIMVIIALLYGAVFIFMFLLEMFSAKISYQKLVSMEVMASETGLKNAERFFVRQVEEIRRLDDKFTRQYSAGILTLDQLGSRTKHIQSTYCGVLRRRGREVAECHSQLISKYFFRKTMDEFINRHVFTSDMHFFAHNFSNTRNSIVLTHREETDGGDLIFVYQLNDSYYWVDYMGASLRSGYFVYDTGWETLAPSRPSFVNMTEVADELRKGGEQGFLIFENRDRNRLVSYMKCGKAEVYLFNSIPMYSFWSFLTEDLNEKLLLYIGFLCAVYAVSWIFYRYICRPIIAIGESLNREIMDETLCFEDSPASSVYSPVIETVNEMKRKISNIKENEYRERLLKEQAELIMLQSQINPHFMYNTLESIRAMAMLEGAQEAPRMVKALADFFRYTISRKDTIVTVREELKNIEDYLTIQNYRFQNKFLYHREFNQEAPYMSCRIIKMMLQPIVENAIFHGLEPMIGQGGITIRIYLTTRHLRIAVKDNGIGISPENLHRLNEEILKSDHVESMENQKHGMALKNVNQRIHLYFGKEYGISIYSKEKVGTEVSISLPIVNEMDQYTIRGV